MYDRKEGVLNSRYISSPALGSAGLLMKRVCYGLVLPGLVVGVVLYVHLPAKYGACRRLFGIQHDNNRADYASLCAGAARHAASDREHMAALGRMDVSASDSFSDYLRQTDREILHRRYLRHSLHHRSCNPGVRFSSRSDGFPVRHTAGNVSSPLFACLLDHPVS